MSPLADFAVPPGHEPPVDRSETDRRAWIRGRWTPQALAALVEHLASLGAAQLQAADGEELRDAWERTVEEMLDPGSSVRRLLDPSWTATTSLSARGLQAGVEAVLGGVRGGPLRRLLAEAAALPAAERGPVAVVLAANLPALAVQPLLPALALRRPVLLKSPSAEPLFAPAFVRRLGQRHPALAAGVAAVTWTGGDRELEDAVVARCARVLAYGEETTIADLARRLGDRLVAYGPRISFAVLGAEADLQRAARGIARDVALFDQRGCLSIHAVFTAGDGQALAAALAAELERLFRAWPPGSAPADQLAAVQQLRLEADMRGLPRPALGPTAGTVVVEPRPELQPSPGLRTVRIHPIEDLGRLPEQLAPWQGRIQGVAAEGNDARALMPELERLGVSRFAPPGALQSPDALWHNGGVHPLAALGGRPL
ncbi:MAG: acyl-CoA reductase [Thermoanaerobaculia bacterium]